jgi:hypothetical protein
MPMRYIQEAEIANEGVRLDSGDSNGENNGGSD